MLGKEGGRHVWGDWLGEDSSQSCLGAEGEREALIAGVNECRCEWVQASHPWSYDITHPRQS